MLLGIDFNLPLKEWILYMLELYIGLNTQFHIALHGHV